MNVYARMDYKSDYDVGLTHRDYTAIDIETTGLNPETDEIIELAAVRYRDGKEVDRFQSLVKPTASISDFIENLTGIGDAMVSDAPGIEDILPAYLLFLGDDVLLGHNIKFDMGFIDEAAESSDLDLPSNKWNDTMLLSRDIFKGERSHKLKDLCSRLDIPKMQEHRALADCIRTHLCYEAMRDYCEKNNIVLRKRSSSKREGSTQKATAMEVPPIVYEERVIRSLNDAAFESYFQDYLAYAKTISIDNPEIEEVEKQVNLLKEEKLRRLDISHSTTDKKTAPDSPLKIFLSFWLLFIGVPIAIAGFVFIFFNYFVPGIITFGVGLILLLICYFNQ